MKPKDLSVIEYGWNKVKPLKKAEALNKDVYGWDTETYKGRLSLMAVVGKDYQDYIIPNNVDELLTFLTRKRFNSSHNFFFNVKYDRDAIIKFLPKKHYHEIRRKETTFYKKWKIDLVGNKSFTISKWVIRKYFQLKDRRVKVTKENIRQYKKYPIIDVIEANETSFFSDISKFYHCGNLIKTAKSVLNFDYKKRKQAIGGVKKQDIDSEWVKYCIEDSEIVYRLAYNLIDMVRSLKIPVKRYYSPASISKTFMRLNLKKSYTFEKKHKIQQFAYKSYSGGRFEILKKGSWGISDNEKVYMADINSAYPYQISKLYKPKGRHRFNPEYEPDSIYSYFLADIEINGDFILSPFKFLDTNKNNMLLFPTGKFKDVYLCKDDYETLKKVDCKIKIKKACHIFNRNPELWLEGIEDVYNKRLEYKNPENYNRLEYVLKLILNSLYGIAYQHNKVKQLEPVFTVEDEKNPDIDFITVIDEKTGKKQTNAVKGYWRAGAFFNPLIACEITAKTRNMLYNDFNKYQDNIIMIATDSVTMNKPIKIKDSIKLGGYGHTKPMNGFVISNGIYHFKAENNGKIKEGKRGLLSNKKIDLMDLVRKGETDKIELIKNRPIGLREGIPKELREKLKYKDYDDNDLMYEMFNQFVPHKKIFDVNADKKRIWDKPLPSFKEILKGHIDSIPIQYGL